MGGIITKVDASKALEKIRDGRPAANRAVYRALNKTAQTVRATAAREIVGAGFNVGINQIKKSLHIDRANAGKLTVRIASRSKPLPLIAFDPRPRLSPVGRGFARPLGGIRATILGAPYGGADAFYARLASGHVGVFHRRSASRLPIVELMGASVPEGLASNTVTNASKSAFEKRFPELLEQQLTYEFGSA